MSVLLDIPSVARSEKSSSNLKHSGKLKLAYHDTFKCIAKGRMHALGCPFGILLATLCLLTVSVSIIDAQTRL